MQHLNSNRRAEDVVYEVPDEVRGDVQAVRELEVELPRLWSRACDLERKAG